MNLKQKLEIILITYNRKECLEKTLKQLLASKSPIKNLDITILDNKSTDGTTELIKNYLKKHSNIKHIIHNHNIGGNANIARALEIAKKEYVWILADDDKYDFTHWKDIKIALNKSPDALVVANYINPKKNTGRLVKQMTFVSGAIYKTANITDTVMMNAYYNISNMFPHLALVCHLLNEGKTIKIAKYPVVEMMYNQYNSSYTRGALTGYPHPYMKEMFWQLGYLNSLKMIKDRKLHAAILNDMQPSNKPFRMIVLESLQKSIFSIRTFVTFVSGLNFRNKIRYFITLPLVSVIAFERKEKGIYVFLFAKLKAKLIPLPYKEVNK